ncbi:serine protease SP24D-like [Drosophila tropicalis]|uniref:serine protease SP24D-like n=1 Tax=Drosophila tropicalis TaxID=46794 RepID=UPI0035ABBF7F
MHRVLSLLFLICCWLQLSVQQARVNTTEPPNYVPRPRIVGGVAARPGQFPYLVSVRFFERHICTGSILNPQFVVTAAHCIYRVPVSLLSIHAGITRLSASGDGEKSQVAKVIMHPSFKTVCRGSFDVALLRLPRNLTFSSEINSIPLAINDPPVNSDVTIAGWGATSHRGPVSNELLFTNVTLLSRQYCVKHHYLRLSATIMCLYHNANVGACHGDSGGPAVYNGELVGIASWVLNLCGLSEPDGYERVSEVREWIIGLIKTNR